MTVATEDRKPKTYRTKPRPVCPRCEIVMVCRCTTDRLRYFYCPIVGCMESAKQERADKII